jgi:uncharacterized delta-60 repeat protein
VSGRTSSVAEYRTPTYWPSCLEAAAVTLLVLLTTAGTALAAAGAPDPSFGANGFAVYDMGYQSKNNSPSSAFAAVAQVPGNRLDLAGESYGGEWRTLVAQVAESGSLESSFATGGFLSSSFGYSDPRSAETELVEPDGSIVVAGSWVVGNVTPSGQVDERFAAYPSHIEVHAIARVAGGDLMAAGSETYGNVPYPATLERLLPDGERDVSFAEKGIDRLPLLSGGEAKEQARSLVVQPDGKMILAGTGSYNAGTRWDSNEVNFMWLARLNPDGSLDRSFGSDGVDYISGFGVGSMLVRHPSGRLLVLGSIFGGARNRRGERIDEPAIWGFTPEGRADTSFGAGGRVVLPRPEAENSAYPHAGAIDPQGRLLMVADQYAPEGTRVPPFVARVSESGQFDTTYASNGFAFGHPDWGFEAVAVDAQGRAIVAGWSGERMFTAYGEPHGGALLARFTGDAVQPATAPEEPSAGSGATGGAGGSPTSTQGSDGMPLPGDPVIKTGTAQSSTPTPALPHKHARPRSCRVTRHGARMRSSPRARRRQVCQRKRRHRSRPPRRPGSSE